MRGLKSHDTASRFCRGYGELLDLLRLRRCHNQTVSTPFCRVRFPGGARIAFSLMTLV